jgi:nitrate/nitrite transporter NarK
MGGYLRDRIGGHKVILTAAVGWSLFTFWMPHVIRLFSAQETSVNFIVTMRILHGAFQGMVFVESHKLVYKKKWNLIGQDAEVYIDRLQNVTIIVSTGWNELL